jgi:hypothetical protein
MTRSTVLHRFSLLVLALALSSLATPASGQENVRVLHRELMASGAPGLYDGIARTRPGWLPAGGANRIAVFVNETYRGDASRLQEMAADSVAEVRWRKAEYVNIAEHPFPKGEFDAVLFVSTRGTGPRPRRRLTASFDVGMSVASMPGATQTALDDAGYSWQEVNATTVIDGEFIYRFENKGTQIPVAAGGTINYRLGEVVGVALTGLHTRTGWSGGYSPETMKTLSTYASSTEGALLATADQSVVRVGVGPAFQRVNWEWASGWCGCNDKTSSSSSLIGAAGEFLVALPLPNVPVRPAMRLFARYYPEREVDAQGETLKVGGLMLTLSAGLATP